MTQLLSWDMIPFYHALDIFCICLADLWRLSWCLCGELRHDLIDDYLTNLMVKRGHAPHFNKCALAKNFISICSEFQITNSISRHFYNWYNMNLEHCWSQLLAYCFMRSKSYRQSFSICNSQIVEIVDNIPGHPRVASLILLWYTVFSLWLSKKISWLLGFF